MSDTPAAAVKRPLYAQKKVWIPAAALAGFIAIGVTADPPATEVAAASSQSEADSIDRLRAQADADRAAADKLAARAAADKAAAEKAAAEKAAAEKAAAEKAAAEKAAAEKAAAEKAAAEKAAAEKAAAPTEAVVDFDMPNFTGVNLQLAQDQVQTKGVFFSVSHDLLAGRMQAFDSNWKVCNQTPAAGTRISGPAADWEGRIDFGTVKLTEACP